MNNAPKITTTEQLDVLLATGVITDRQAADFRRKLEGKIGHGAGAVADPPAAVVTTKVTNLDGDRPTDAKSIKLREAGANVPVDTLIGFKVYGSEKTTRGARIVPVTYSQTGKAVPGRSMQSEHVVALGDAKLSSRIAAAVSAIDAAWLIGSCRPATAASVGAEVSGDTDF